MIVFDGKQRAEEKERTLIPQVEELRASGVELKVAAILFAEDSGSLLYTQLKKEAAERVGIAYEVTTFSLTDSSEAVATKIHELNEDPSVTGTIIQKPWRKTWQAATMVDGSPKDIKLAFSAWWTYLTSQIALEKDVDGLHPKTLAAIEAGTWRQAGRVMPATAAAVLEILEEAGLSAAQSESQPIVIIGMSDILGKPLYYELSNQGFAVEMIGSGGLKRRVEQGKYLLDARAVVSATGRHHLVTGEMVSPGVVVVDVGEPRPDVAFDSVSEKAGFITPVPGGVGPMTVACLLENAVALGKHFSG